MLVDPSVFTIKSYLIPVMGCNSASTPSENWTLTKDRYSLPSSEKKKAVSANWT